MSRLALSRLLLALIVALVAFDAFIAGRPPRVLPEGAPESTFSGARALAFAHEILPDAKPHATGTSENARVRERIVAAFTRLGYAPETQTAFSCGSYGSCATVTNVIARLPGKRKEAVLVAAHYDSVPGGPGVGDDLAGAASVLEIARALHADGADRDSSVVFLIDDGEELGLLGAQAFAERHPLAADVRWAVNLDNRGDSGAAMMFETSAGNAGIAAAMGRALSRPVSSSLFYEVYKRMPNDTDFTVWKSKGIRGVNFAFIGSAARYHTPSDDFAHLDPRSVQHEGACALEMARAFREADPNAPATGDATYFDLFGSVLLRWPAGASVPLALLAFALVAGAAIVRIRRGDASRSGVLIGVGAWLLSILAAVFASSAVARLLHLGVSLSPWPEQPAAALVAFAFVGVTCAAFARAVVHRVGSESIEWTAWLPFTILGVAAAVAMPGASYLFVVPGVAAGGAALAGARFPRADRGLARDALPLVPVCAFAIVWTPVFAGIYAGLGLAIAPIFSVIAVLAAWPLVALPKAKSRLVSLAFVCTGVVLVASFAFSARAPDPAKTSLWLVGDGASGRASLFANPISGSPPPRLLHDAKLDRESAPLPWLGAWPARPAGPIDLPPPTWDVADDAVENGDRVVSGVIRSARGATELRVGFSPEREVKRVRIEDRDVPAIGQRALARHGGWRVYRIDAIPEDGIRFTVTLAGAARARATFADVSFGLPESSRETAALRDRTGLAMQDGDLTIVLGRGLD